ncbi:hypothetical protein SAMN05216567_11860 [Variovorax sp. OK605]|uniref:hypothetical protein n=1 Tax=Variovorax sp. OK605 TaxID=1855317 RepID=UPI0008F26C74|nr:hypothetical protein [Variovorax sp. OK605]SFQ52141.1 hypothetical protein SAMN05216567_11860 [Variovorax sp. OK605]
MTPQEPTRLRTRPAADTIVLSAADAAEAKLTQLHSLLWCISHSTKPWTQDTVKQRMHLVDLAFDLASAAKTLLEESRK